MNIEYIKQMLDGEGLRTELLPEGHALKFKFEFGNYFFFIDPEDTGYVRLIYPNFWGFEESDRSKLAVIAHDCTRDFKAAKIMILESQVWASVEFYVANEEGLKAIFRKCLDAVQGIAKAFTERAGEATTKKSS